MTQPPSHTPPPSLLRNPISWVGLLLTTVSTAFGLPLMFLDLFSRERNPYLGVVIYLILPVTAAVGIMIALIGVVWERRRRLRDPSRVPAPLPRLDLNRPSHQAIVLGVFAGSLILIVLLSITGYQAYHFTESVQFCGLLCHQVMKPEYTTYQHSPHARVACVQCHVGPGADWFVRSKLSGLYQVYATATNRYPRPIPTPIKNLRPAQDTCEQCHWPEKFFGAQQRTLTRYLADEANTPWRIQMLLKVGGGDRQSGAPSGIHWHMNIKNDISYIASDERREVIPWVQVTDPEGHVTVYQSTEQPLSKEQLVAMTPRRMDCMDCHNRPAHRYQPPDRAMDAALESGRVDQKLPYIKREGMRLVAGEYASEAQAKETIRRELMAFYEKQYPAVARKRAAIIEQAAVELGRIYAANLFPEMHADWRAYPDHLGHLHSDGCFRCHDGLHQSAEGKVITKDCAACHTILSQGSPEETASARLEEQPFHHPVDVGMDVTELKCSQCHNGTSGL